MPNVEHLARFYFSFFLFVLGAVYLFHIGQGIVTFLKRPTMAVSMQQAKMQMAYIPSEKDPRCPLCGDYLDWKQSKPTGKLGGAYFVACDHPRYPQYTEDMIGKGSKFFAKAGCFVDEYKAFSIKEKNIKRKLESMTPEEIREEIQMSKRSKGDGGSELRELRATVDFLVKRVEDLEAKLAPPQTSE